MLINCLPVILISALFILINCLHVILISALFILINCLPVTFYIADLRSSIWIDILSVKKNNNNVYILT